MNRPQWYPRLTRFIPVFRFGMLIFLCFFGWLIISQDFSTASLIMGAVFAVIAAAYSYRIFFDQGAVYRSDLFLRFDLLLLYILLILFQSYLASLEMIRLMITRKYHPGIIRIRTSLRSPLGRIILANSITLIPGTLSLWLDEDHIYVHWFDQKTENSIKAGRMIKGSLESLLKRITG